MAALEAAIQPVAGRVLDGWVKPGHEELI